MEEVLKKELQESELAGAQLLMQCLKEAGVELLFGYPGGAVLPIYDAIYDGLIPHVLTRHEQGAVHAAEGYAKATGKPGVVIVTSGPGATNVITGIADAMSDSVPLVVITGQVATSGIGKDAFQEADILGITMPITKNNYQVRDIKDLPRVINEAFYLANTGRKGPVVIDLPKDLTAAKTKVPASEAIKLPSYQVPAIPNPLQVKRLVQALQKSKKPAVLVGQGIILSDAEKELLAFIEKYQIPTLCTLLGLGVVPYDHELFLGMGGMHGTYAANMALSECDLLINIGSRFDDRLASAPDQFAPNAVIAHVDIDPAEIGKIIDTKIPIVGDAKETLNMLLAEEFVEVDCENWRQTNQKRKEKYPYTYDRLQKAEIKPQKVVEFVGELTKGKATIVTDVGQHQMWAAQYYPYQKTKQLITSGGLGTMGYGIPAAIGAKLADLNQEVVLFVGDGGFQMTNQELAILNEYQLDLKIVLMNNHSLGMVRQWQESFFDKRRSHSVFKQQPNFMKLAEAYDIASYKISDAASFETEFEKAFRQKGPVLIEVEVAAGEHVLPMVPPGQANDQMLGVEG